VPFASGWLDLAATVARPNRPADDEHGVLCRPAIADIALVGERFEAPKERAGEPPVEMTERMERVRLVVVVTS
jgi:hypothetical protein